MASSSANETSKQGKNQQTEESSKTNTASSSNTNWELQGARPKPTQRQRTENPPLRPVSDGLAKDFLARNSQDTALVESLVADNRVMPSLDASEAYSEGPYFGAMGASSNGRFGGAVQSGVAEGATALVKRRLREREEQKPQRDEQMIREERREREEQEEFTRKLQRKEQKIREQRERKKREESIRELQREEQMVREKRERETREEVKRERQRREQMIREERERQEREEFMRELQRKEQMIREERERERREKEDREWQEAERWPPQQEGVSTGSRWLCEHYQRRCRVRFPCCTQFYPCHHCHNSSSRCQNDEAKAWDATQLKCSCCQLELEMDENSNVCTGCGEKMAAYFCAICKEFAGVDEDPYHCDECGICRYHKEGSYHCKVCNVCLDKRLENNHKCRPDAGHEECCICLEVVFSGCRPHVLQCSHAMHLKCLEALLKSGIDTCPSCQEPIQSPLKESSRHHGLSPLSVFLLLPFLLFPFSVLLLLFFVVVFLLLSVVSYVFDIT